MVFSKLISIILKYICAISRYSSNHVKSMFHEMISNKKHFLFHQLIVLALCSSLNHTLNFDELIELFKRFIMY